MSVYEVFLITQVDSDNLNIVAKSKANTARSTFPNRLGERERESGRV